MGVVLLEPVTWRPGNEACAFDWAVTSWCTCTNSVRLLQSGDLDPPRRDLDYAIIVIFKISAGIQRLQRSRNVTHPCNISSSKAKWLACLNMYMVDSRTMRRRINDVHD